MTGTEPKAIVRELAQYTGRAVPGANHRLYKGNKAALAIAERDVVPVEYAGGNAGRVAEGRGEIGNDAVGRVGKAGGSEGPGKAKGANIPVVKEAAARGRKRHKEYDYGPGIEKEKILPSGKRMDGYDAKNKIVYELKPNNPKAVQKGLKQLDEYVEEANEVYGHGHMGKLHTYDK
jgi:hypothetical protein